jgi:hypothetical protein
MHFLFRDWPHFTPEPMHVCAKDSSRGFRQSRGINQVIRTPRMNVNGRAGLGEVPGRPGMIEMNVAEKDMAHVVRRKTRNAHFERDGLESGIGAGIEKHDPVVRRKCDRGDYSAVAEVTGVENVDHSLTILNTSPYSHSIVLGGLVEIS